MEGSGGYKIGVEIMEASRGAAGNLDNTEVSGGRKSGIDIS